MARVGGLIAYYELDQWWLHRWTPAQRNFIETKWDTPPYIGAYTFSPLCTGRRPSKPYRSMGPDHAGRLLIDLGALMKEPGEFMYAKRLFEDADQMLPADDWYNRHFLFHSAGACSTVDATTARRVSSWQSNTTQTK